MLTNLSRRLIGARAAIDRATPIPFLLRLGIALCGLVAMIVAWPAGLVTSQYFVLLTLVAIYPAAAPRGRGATFAAMVVVAGWILDTAGYSLTALAAVLPYDAVVNVDVVAHWLLRALAVVLLSAVLTVVALGLSADLAGGPFLIATLIGLAGAVGATVLIARLLQRAGNL
jgi:hypothetical protein